MSIAFVHILLFLGISPPSSTRLRAGSPPRWFDLRSSWRTSRDNAGYLHLHQVDVIPLKYPELRASSDIHFQGRTKLQILGGLPRVAFKRWTSGKPQIWGSFLETFVLLLGVKKNGRGPEKSNKGRFKVKPKGGLPWSTQALHPPQYLRPLVRTACSALLGTSSPKVRTSKYEY